MTLTRQRIQPTIRFRDAHTTDELYNSGSDLLMYHITYEIDQPGQLEYEMGLGNTGADAMQRTLGPIPDKVEVAVSLNGGHDYWSRKMVQKVTRTLSADGGPSLTESGDDMFTGYATSGIDHATFANVTFRDALYGAPGTIVAHRGPNNEDLGLLVPGSTIPFQKGIFWTAPGDEAEGLYGPPDSITTYVPVLPDLVGDLIVSCDIWGDYIMNGLTTITQDLGGQFIQDDTAFPGSRGHWVADSSDGTITNTSSVMWGSNLNMTGITRGLAVGFVGDPDNPFMTFSSRELAHGDSYNLAAEAVIADGMTTESSTDDIYAECEFTGGSSNHNLADGHNITGIKLINTGRPSPQAPATGDAAWDSNLPIVSIFVDALHGGVYYLGPDEIFHPMSPAFGVNCLEWYKNTSLLICGTQAGVLTKDMTLRNYQQQGWVTLPGLTQPIAEIHACRTSDDDLTPVIWARCTGTGAAVNGLFRYPAFTGDVLVNSGYGAFSRPIQSSTVVTFCAVTGRDIFYVDKADLQTVVKKTFNDVDPTQPPATTLIPVPLTGGNITSITYLPETGYIYIATQSGSCMFYYMDPTVLIMYPAAAPGNLVDSSGANPVQVNSVVGYNGSINDVVVAVMAATDHGLYVTNSVLGGIWRRCNGQSGMDDVNLLYCAPGTRQQFIGRDINVVVAATKTEMYLSRTGTIYWKPIISSDLALLPFFGALHAEITHGGWPDNDVGSWGSIVDDYTLPSPGSLITIPTTSQRLLPFGWYWSRRLDEHSDWTGRLVNSGSASPFKAIMFGQLTQLQGNSYVPYLVASEGLAQVHYRWLTENSLAQTIVTMESDAMFDDSPLLYLRPTMAVAVNMKGIIARYDDAHDIYTSTYVDYENEVFFVLSHELQQMGGDILKTTTKCGKLLLEQRSTPDQIAADMMYSIKNIKRFGI